VEVRWVVCVFSLGGFFSGSDLDMRVKVTITATRTNSPIGRNTPNRTSPTLSAKTHK